VGGRRFGVEVKFSESPRITRSMRVALANLALEHLYVVYPGADNSAADPRITVWPIEALALLPSEMRRSREVAGTRSLRTSRTVTR
jgi:hypothetical protein